MSDIGFEGQVIAELTALRLCVQFALGKIAIIDGDGDKELERLRALVIEAHQKQGINIHGTRSALIEAHAEDAINRRCPRDFRILTSLRRGFFFGPADALL